MILWLPENDAKYPQHIETLPHTNWILTILVLVCVPQLCYLRGNACTEGSHGFCLL